MQKGFVAEEFIKLMMLSLQGKTGYLPMQGGIGLCKQDFAALYTVEAVLIAPDGIERFCSMIEKKAEDSIHSVQRSRVFTTLIIIPARQLDEESSFFEYVSGDEYFSVFSKTKKKCMRLGYLLDIAVADFTNGSCTSIGTKNLSDKKVAKALHSFVVENSSTENDCESVAQRLSKCQSEYTERRRQAARINEKRSVNPLVLLIIINVLVFFLGAYFEITTGTDPLKEWGIQNNELIRKGEIWRLFTPMFLHADAAHLFGNMLALLYLGKITLDYYTVREFSAIYFFSGLIGNVLSFLFTDYLSLGASGAVMGLGGMLIYRMFFGKHAKSFRMAGNYAAMVLMVVFNLFYGVFAVGANIDNFGHFGGFIGGFVMAALISFLRQRRSNRENRRTIE